jgi:hypothetical protein
LFIDDVSARQRLLANRIFVATYWPNMQERVSTDSLEYKLVKNCLPIPCDQRYDASELMAIFSCIN